MSDDYDMESDTNKKRAASQSKKLPKTKQEMENEIHNAAKLQAARSLKIEKHNTDCEEFPYDTAEVFIKVDENNLVNDKTPKIELDEIRKDLPLCIKDEEQLLIMCNLKSFDILLQLVRLVDEKYPPNQRCLISTRDCIILTLARLTLDISFAALSVFYRKSNGATIGQIFFDTIKKLANILESVVTCLPQNQKVLKWYEKESGITEHDSWMIKLEKPSCEKCYFERYYHHMKEYAVDFTVALNPNGITICVSGKYYEPPTSDDDDLDDETYMKRMKKTDTVMPDRNYFIDKESLATGIKLFDPERSKSVGKGDLPTKKEIQCTKEHLVSMRKWFNKFKAFEDTFPWSFVDSIHDIFIVCCALAVLQTPLLEVNKF